MVSDVDALLRARGGLRSTPNFDLFPAYLIPVPKPEILESEILRLEWQFRALAYSSRDILLSSINLKNV